MKNTLPLHFVLFGFSLFFAVFSACQSPRKEKQEMDFPFTEWEISSFHQAYQNGTWTVEGVIEAYLERIKAIDQNGPELHSIILVNPKAKAIAKELDSLFKIGISKGPLHGIPVVLKDNLDTKDMFTTAGSRAMETSLPLQDSEVAEKLMAAGAVILGKANLSEWANFRGNLSSSGWSGLGGQTKNPYILDRNPCGSSSGSAVAVSANLSVLAIGTETNGSIVCPSHANGIVGIKPTVGLISRSGVIPISFTQDTPGPMARTVRDAAICLGTLVGVDSADSKTLESHGNYTRDYTQFLKIDGLAGKRIGWFKGPSGRHFKVDALMEKTIRWMEDEGAVIVPVEQIMDPSTGGFSFQVMLYEYKEGLNNYFASLGPDAPIKNLEELIAFNRRDSIELRYHNQHYLEMAKGKKGLDSEEYQNALTNMLRQSREEGIDRVLQENQLDAIVAPTGSPAWKTDWINGDGSHLGSSSPAAQAGYPNITLPMGMIDGLPVGISIFGTAWSEPQLLEIAYTLEQGTMQRKEPTFLEPSY